MTRQKLLLLDIDGTFYFKNKLLPGAVKTLAYIRQQNIPFLFLTNTDARPARQIAASLRDLGLMVKDDEVFTPISALNQLLTQTDSNAYYLVNDAVIGELPTTTSENIDYVVIGDCSDKVSYANLNEAFSYLMNGAELLATQKGKYFLRDNGYNLDTGGFVAMFEYSAQKQATVMGKPSKTFFDMAIAKLAVEYDEIWVVGDDVLSDIKGANAINAVSILVKTGKYELQKDDPACERARVIISGIGDLPTLLNSEQLS